MELVDTKIEYLHNNKNLAIQRQTVEDEIKTIGLDGSKFINSLDLVISKLLSFIKRYEIDFESFLKPNTLIRGLALMDLWIENGKNKGPNQAFETQRILSQFKFISIDDHSYKQLSQKIIRSSQSNNPRATKFDPEHVHNSTSTYSIYKKIEQEHCDLARSKFVNDNISLIIQEIFELRDELGIEKIAPFNFEVKVLNLTTDELENYQDSNGNIIGSRAFYTITHGKFIISIPFDSEKFKKTFFHEFTHSESSVGIGISEGFQFDLGRGFNEGLTESLNFTPSSYAYPRYILEQIYKAKQGLKQLATDCYFGKKPRIELTKAIFNTFGSEGLAKFEFCTSSHFDIFPPLNNLILFNFKEVLEFFVSKNENENIYFTDIKRVELLQKKFDEIKIANSLPEYKSAISEQRIAWFAGPGQQFYEIRRSLDNIYHFNHNCPIEYLFENSDDKYTHFQNILHKLEDYNDFRFDIDTTEISQIASELKEIETFLNNRFNAYWNRGATNPLFKGRKGSWLETAWMKSELMQKRSLFKKN